MSYDDAKSPPPVSQQPESQSNAVSDSTESRGTDGSSGETTVEETPRKRGIGGREKGKKHNYPKDRASPALSNRRVAKKVASLGPKQKIKAEEFQRAFVVGTGALIGLKQTKIAEVSGIGRRRIPEYLEKLAPVFPKIQELAEYREYREKMIASVEQTALESVVVQLTSCNPDDKLRDKAYAFDVLHRAGRLERGASTSNVSVKAQYTEVSLDTYEEPSSGD